MEVVTEDAVQAASLAFIIYAVVVVASENLNISTKKKKKKEIMKGLKEKDKLEHTILIEIVQGSMDGFRGS